MESNSSAARKNPDGPELKSASNAFASETVLIGPVFPAFPGRASRISLTLLEAAPAFLPTVLAASIAVSPLVINHQNPAACAPPSVATIIPMFLRTPTIPGPHCFAALSIGTVPSLETPPLRSSHVASFPVFLLVNRSTSRQGSPAPEEPVGFGPMGCPGRCRDDLGSRRTSRRLPREERRCFF